jgi:hypothetical protein
MPILGKKEQSGVTQNGHKISVSALSYLEIVYKDGSHAAQVIPWMILL